MGKLQVDLIERSISQGQDFSNNHTSLLLLRDLLEKYLSDEHIGMGRSKRYSLEAIKEFDIANTKLSNLKPKHIVDFCKERKSGGASPATIACDISHIRAVCDLQRRYMRLTLVPHQSLRQCQHYEFLD